MERSMWQGNDSNQEAGDCAILEVQALAPVKPWDCSPSEILTAAS